MSPTSPRTSARRTRLAAEAAGIAGILVFAWMRDSPREATKARVAALAEAVKARYADARTSEDVRAIHRTLRVEFPTATSTMIPGDSLDPGIVWCEDPAPWFRLGLASALLQRNFRPGTFGSYAASPSHFWATLEFECDDLGGITNITIERLEDVLGSASPTPW